jgi:hypothetical protein
MQATCPIFPTFGHSLAQLLLANNGQSQAKTLIGNYNLAPSSLEAAKVTRII